MKAHVADGGRGRLSGRVITLSAALFLAGTAGAQCLTSEFGVPGEFLGAQDGRSVAVDGDLLVVGAPYSTESLGAPQSGAAFVFERRSGDWVQTARLAPDDAAQAQRFGWSVAISGERIAVGAPWDPLYTHQSFPPGAAYLFERTGDAWAQTAKVVGSGAEANAMLGWSVALDGDVLAVGGPLQVALGSGATGRVWIFERAGAAWHEVLGLSGLWSAAWFGSALALDGDTLLASAPSGAGRVLVVQRTLLGWIPVQELHGAEPPVGGRFGDALDLDGDLAVVGAPDQDAGVPLVLGAGAAYRFERTGGVWLQAETWVDPARTPYARFGDAVAVGDEVVLVGAPFAAGAPTTTGAWGRVSLFENVDETWVPRTALLAPDGGAYEEFGRNVVAAGDDLVVLSPYADGPYGGVGTGSGPGALYRWSRSASDCPSLLALASSVSLGGGGSQPLLLNAGADHAGEPYLLLGSSAGTAPGLALGPLLLPLAFDGIGGYLLFTLSLPNTPPLADSFGLLDADGLALAHFELPPGALPALAGLVLHHAYLAFETSGPSIVFASEAAAVELVP